MPDAQPDYTRFAGRVAFPRDPRDLVGTTQCPACFAAVRSTVCATCGLDLGHPAAAELYDASLAAAAALERRLAIIGRIRYDTAQATTRAAEPIAVAPAVPEPTPPASLVQASMAPVTPLVAPTAAPQAPAPVTAHEPRRSSVQVTLLVVGVSLLSIAAIFFLVYAFINFGIVWRSVIIGAITAAALVVASVLKQRNLTATAEGIASFGVVLIYLDAYALRANDLLGAAAVDGTVYWGVALVATAIGFMFWHRMSGLRIPNIAGFAAFAPGVGVLVGGLTRELDEATQVFLVAAAIALAGLVHALAPRPALEARDDRAARPAQPALPERAIVLSTTGLALLVGFLLAFGAFPSSDWAPAFAAAGLAAVATFHIFLLLRPRGSASSPQFATVFSFALSAIAGIALASALWISVTRSNDFGWPLVVPALWAAVVALTLEGAVATMKRRVAASPPAQPSAQPSVALGSMIVGAWASAGITALAMIAPAIIAVSSVGAAVARTALPVWSFEPSAAVARFSPESGWAVLAFTTLTVIAAIAWTRIGTLHARSVVLACGAAFTLLIAAPELRSQWVVMAAWLLIAVAALAALLTIRTRMASLRRYLPVLMGTMIVTAALGYLLGWATTSTWWVGTLVVVGILVLGRGLVESAPARAALLGFAVAATVLSVGFIADQFALGTDPIGNATLLDHVMLTSLTAVGFLIVAALSNGVMSISDKRVVFWSAGTFGASALTLTSILSPKLSAAERSSQLFPQDLTSLIAAIALLIALGLWLFLPCNKPLRPERVIASVAAGPVLYLLFTAFARVLDIPQFVPGVAPITAALFAAVGALAITTLRGSTTPRWARELSVVLVGIPAVITAVRTDDGYTWLVLVIAAVATLLLAVDAHGLFSTHSMRRHLGWLAIALGTAGLWWRLNGDHVTDLLSYLLPLFVVLFLVAQFIQRAARRSTPAYDSPVSPIVTLAAVLILMVPLSINEASVAPSQVGVYFIAAIVLLIGGSAIIGKTVTQWNADALAAAGAITVIAHATTRAAFLPLAGVERDLWLAAAVVPLIVAAFLQVRRHRVGTAGTRAFAAQWLAIAALTLALMIETVSFGVAPDGGIRATVLVMIFAAVHVIASLVNRAPLTHAVAWVGIGFAAVTGVFAWNMNALDPVEVATVPIAIALIVTAAQNLAAVPTVRSWARLGPATALLLIPSLIITADDNALWRLVALGVVGVAVIVVAVVSRLQAPFVIGVVVVLWHGIATFLPQLRAAYEFFPWWLWLGVGGVLLIVLAARYERRIRDLKNALGRFSALR